MKLSYLQFINYTHAIWDFVDSPALQDLKPVIIAANIDAFFILKDLPPPNFTKVFAYGDALPEHLIRGYICSNLHVDIVPKGDDCGIYVYIYFWLIKKLCYLCKLFLKTNNLAGTLGQHS